VREPGLSEVDESAGQNRGPAMNANQVVIVMDREGAEMIERVTAGALIGSPTRAVNAPVRAALDRDPDELVEQIARTLDPPAFDEWAKTDGGLPFAFRRTEATDKARSVLAVLGEEGGPE
jgi:hypothetical protein